MRPGRYRRGAGTAGIAADPDDRVRAGILRQDGRDRFGIAGQRPAPLADLPKFPNDKLDPARCGGDIVIQACANDPQVAVHAIRNLARVGFGTAAVRYSQLGFGRTSSTTRDQSTPRNMFGFRTEPTTSKPKTPRHSTSRWVAGGDGPDWLAAPTWCRGESACASSRGTAPHCTNSNG